MVCAVILVLITLPASLCYQTPRVFLGVVRSLVAP